ncbi:MAG: hypothetical protein J5965_08150 [Aeriscardovia sp.]|nr:hypothetical protein [Aeriscardovia sp.]
MRKKIIAGLIIVVLLAGCGKTTEEAVVTSEDQFSSTASVSVIQDIGDTENTILNETSSDDNEKSTDTNNISIGMYYVYDIKNIKVHDMSVFLYTDEIVSESGSLFVQSPTSHMADSHNIDGTPRIVYNEQFLALTEDNINEIRDFSIDFYDANIADLQGMIDELYIESEKIWAKDDTNPLMDCTDKFPKTLTINVNGEDISIEVDECLIKSFSSGSVSGMPEDSPLVKSDKHNDYLTEIHLMMNGKSENMSSINLFYEKLGGYNSKNSGIESELKNITFSDSLTYEQLYEATEEKNATIDDFDLGIIGKWYPGRTDFNEYYIQVDEGGTGAIHRDGETISLSYSFDGKTLHINDAYGVSRDFYYSDDKLVSDVDGEVYQKKDSKETSRVSEQKAQSVDLTGTWYDPTRLSYQEFVFNGDGTGIYDFGGGDTRDMTYTVSGNTISYQLPRSSGTLSIVGDKLYDGESYYVKK